MFLRVMVWLQVSFITLMAGGATNTGKGINAIKTQLGIASNLVNPSKGADATGFNLVQYTIIFLGIIIMGMGINDTFVAEDRGGENKKMKGVLKMIGGACFIAIPSIYNLFASKSI